MCQHVHQVLCELWKVKGNLQILVPAERSGSGEQRSGAASPVSVEVLWEVMLHKVTAGSIIIEADFMAGVDPAPGLHHGDHC